MTETNFQHRVKVYLCGGISLLLLAGCSVRPTQGAASAPGMARTAPPPEKKVNGDALLLALREVNDAPQEASWKFDLECYREIIQTSHADSFSKFVLGKPTPDLRKYRIGVVLKVVNGELQEELSTETVMAEGGLSRISSLASIGPAPKGVRPAQMLHPIDGGSISGQSNQETIILSSPSTAKPVFQVSLTPAKLRFPRVKATATQKAREG